MITQINVFVCEICFKETVVVNKGVDIWSDPTVIPPEGETWGYVGERFACPSCLAIEFFHRTDKVAEVVIRKAEVCMMIDTDVTVEAVFFKRLNWQIGDDLGLRLDQVSDEETQDVEVIERMLSEINLVIAAYGFKISAVNRWPDFRRAAVEEVRLVDDIQEVLF